MTHLQKLGRLPHMTDRYVYANKHCVSKEAVKSTVVFTFDGGAQYIIHYPEGDKVVEADQTKGYNLTSIY